MVSVVDGDLEEGANGDIVALGGVGEWARLGDGDRLVKVSEEGFPDGCPLRRLGDAPILAVMLGARTPVRRLSHTTCQKCRGRMWRANSPGRTA